MTVYSHRSLRDKLGIKPGMRLYLQNSPSDVLTALGDLDDDTSIVSDEELANFFLYFVTSKTQLSVLSQRLERLKEPHQLFWIAWPKKSSNIPSELGDQALRDALLPIGLVDIKVCAISDIYSGLKFVWRSEA